MLNRSKPEALARPAAAGGVYASEADYLREAMAWLDASIEARLHRKAQGEQAEQPGPTTEAAAYRLAGSGIPRSAAVERLLTEAEAIRQQFDARTRASIQADLFLPLPHLAAAFRLSPLEEKAILVCLAAELDRKFEFAFELLQGGGKHPTVDTVASLIARDETEWRTVVRCFRPEGMLQRFFLAPADKTTGNWTNLSRPVRLAERIARFIMHGPEEVLPSERHFRICLPSEAPPPLIGNAELQRKLVGWIERYVDDSGSEGEGAPLLIALWGKKGAGKSCHLKHIGHHFGEPLLFVDLDKLGDRDLPPQAALDEIVREAAIRQAIPVLVGLRHLPDPEERLRWNSGLLERIGRQSGLFFLEAQESCRSFDPDRLVALELEVRELEHEERAAVWRALAAPYRIDPTVDWDELSAQFLFNPGQIKSALKEARALAGWSDEREQPAIGPKNIVLACYRQLDHKLENRAKRLNPIHDWDELILPADQKEKLQHACNHIRYKHAVYGTWGFGRKLSYGTGINLLFSGPPGTGKTMASETIARELDMEIYKIDLSQIISKYIGETEKNLREIFDEAQSAHAVLFFDEADALFGKRSEVKDSHDKNANTEVAYLLQLTEEYRGISVLATNFLQNIDAAFLRRINYVIRFPLPDEQERTNLWKRIFPAAAPLDEDIDYGYLGRKFPLAGGTIKNIALTAAFLAKNQEATIGMKHILKAYQYELDKNNRGLTKDDLGEYAYLFQELTQTPFR